MAIPILAINYIAVLVSAIIGFVIGMAWYKVFGRQWMSLMGLTPEKLQGMKKGMAKPMLGGFVATLIMAFVLAHVIGYSQASTIPEGLMGGFWVWLGFVATVMINSVLWEGKPVKLYALNVAHYLVVLLVMGAILAVWV